MGRHVGSMQWHSRTMTGDSAISDQAKTPGNLRVIVTDSLTEPHSWLRRKITASTESRKSGTRSWIPPCKPGSSNQSWKRWQDTRKRDYGVDESGSDADKEGREGTALTATERSALRRQS